MSSETGTLEQGGGGRDTPDPGTPLAAKIAWIATVVLMVIVVVVNQLPEKEATPEAKAEVKSIEPPDPAEPFTLVAKFFVKGAHSWSIDPSSSREVVDSLVNSAKSDADRVRVAIVAADLLGPQAGLDRIKALGEVTGPLAEDVQTLRDAYEGDGKVADPAARARLEDHHGWFGKLANTAGLPDTDPARAPLLAGAGKMIALMVFGGMVGVVAVVGGIGGLIVMAVMIGTGRLKRRFVAPAPGGSVFIETVPVFIAAFLLLHLGMALATRAAAVNGEPPSWLMPLQLCAQWGLVVFPLWPLMRGMSGAEFRRRLGWTSGQGVLREMGAGIAAYFAGLPLLGVVVLFTAGALILKEAVLKRMHPGQDVPIPSNHIAELIGKGSPLVLVMLYVLATMWAPLVEEAIFRGAMYRQLRSRLGMFSAAILSALTFGLMHGYSLILLGPVICLGFVFALMREWRGSLIGSMTAHFLHNATALALVLLALSALKD